MAYGDRKAARLRGEPVKSRNHESPPWYTWRMPGQDSGGNPIQRLERELARYGEASRKMDRLRAEERASRWPGGIALAA